MSEKERQEVIPGVTTSHSEAHGDCMVYMLRAEIPKRYADRARRSVDESLETAVKTVRRDEDSTVPKALAWWDGDYLEAGIIGHGRLSDEYVKGRVKYAFVTTLRRLGRSTRSRDT